MCVALDCRVGVCARRYLNLIALFSGPFSSVSRQVLLTACSTTAIPRPATDAVYREANYRHRNGLAVLFDLDLSGSECFPVAEILNALCDGFGYGVPIFRNWGLHAVDLETRRDGVVGGGGGGGDALGHE